MVGSEPQVTAALSSPMSFSSFFIVFVFMYFQTIFHKCYVFNISLIVSHIQISEIRFKISMITIDGYYIYVGYLHRIR